MIFNVASALTLLAISTSAAATGKPGQIVQITSASSWCMMMPPQAGGDIAANEDRAIAFCTNPSSSAPGAKLFPEGFIQSANFASGNGYVQITGKIDSSKYSLSSKDQGGQYDIRAPVGSACSGYNHYVNLIEPHSNTMCIRCCKEKKDCNTGKSTYGCAYVIPGDYSGGNSNTSASASSASTTAAVTATNSPSATGSGSATATASPSVTGSASVDPTVPTVDPTAPSVTTALPTSTVSPSATTVAPIVSPTVPVNSAAATNSQSVGILAAAALGVAAILAL
ncbi:hypothetical protein BGZ95_004739 [Linnemannia exigua]|uniref:Uncharacterized protein n=1 Tax=Linnemannia exigua TaxID=604196 RepID=A0AAD4H0M8_9FUNG|nr:hypothetical protein BGZ95_004739 [Linnemannia exigua]